MVKYKSPFATIVSYHHLYNKQSELPLNRERVSWWNLDSKYKHAYLLLGEFYLFEGAVSIWIDLNYTTAQCQQGPVGKNNIKWADCVQATPWRYSDLSAHVDPTAAIEGLGVSKWGNDGLNCACPNLSGEKGQRIPRGKHCVQSAFNKFPSHLVRGQSDSKNEFDVTQKPISVAQMCLPQIKINHSKPQRSPVTFKEHLCKALVISLTGTFMNRTIQTKEKKNKCFGHKFPLIHSATNTL